MRVGDGTPGPGRPKGSINKETLVKAARLIMEAKGYNPIEHLMRRALDESLPQDIRQSSILALADRYAPRLKAIEITTEKNNAGLGGVQINIVAGPSAPTMVLDAVDAAKPALEHAVQFANTVNQAIGAAVDEMTDDGDD